MSRYWWILVVRGVMAILLGACAFAWPLPTAAALVFVFGALALADGILAVTAAIAGRRVTRDWWVLPLQGLLGIGVGVLALLNPALTAVALVIYIAAWAIGVGVLQVIVAVRLRHDISGEWWLALSGIAGVAFGILLMWRPAAGALTVLWLIGTFALVWGVTIAGFGIRRLRKHTAA